MKTRYMTSLFIVLLTISACSTPGQVLQPTFTPCPTVASSSAAACPLPTRTAQPLPAGALFQVLLPDSKYIVFTSADLAKLTAVQLNAGGQTQSGWLLQDVLAAAGAAAYNQVIFNGETTVILQKEQIDSQVALVISNSARLVAPSLPAEQQVSGIITIRVK